MAETTEIHPESTTPSIETGIDPAVKEAAAVEQAKPIDPRAKIMEQIYKKREEQIELEAGTGLGETPKPKEAAPAEPEPEPESEPTPEPAQSTSPAPAAEAAAETPATPPESSAAAEPQPETENRTRYRLKVNGKDLHFTEDELRKAAQKGLAADEKFTEAARMRDEAQALLNRLSQVQPAPQAPQQNPVPHQAPVSSQQAPTSIPKDEAVRLARDLSYGDEEAQARAIQRLAELRPATQAPQGPAPEDIARFATQNAVAQIRFETNLATIGSEFPEVFNDRDLTILAANKLHDLRAHYAQVGEAKTDLELYREAAKAVKDKFAKPSENPQPTPESGEGKKPTASAAAPTAQVSQTRVERKRAAPQPPTSASRRAEAPAQPAAPSNRDIINRMRQARGQPALV